MFENYFGDEKTRGIVLDADSVVLQFASQGSDSSLRLCFQDLQFHVCFEKHQKCNK